MLPLKRRMISCANVCKHRLLAASLSACGEMSIQQQPLVLCSALNAQEKKDCIQPFSANFGVPRLVTYTASRRFTEASAGCVMMSSPRHVQLHILIWGRLFPAVPECLR
ncbi:unnamed protein product [Effrenium voratum]|nr:unnamed protein product [Effrenium voratum]